MRNMPDNIFFKDLDSKFIMVNTANVHRLGFENEDEVIGKDDFDLFEERFARAAREDEQRVMETGQSMDRKEERVSWPDGSVTWVTSTKVPLRDKDGDVVGLIGIGRDISEIKEKELELEEANRMLSEVNRKLSEVNEQISEDLRMAARLQQTFLPRTYPEFFSDDETPLLDFHHYYEAITEVGGDFCSAHKLSDTKAGLLICDVMGHGARAALITSMVKTIADNLSKHTESPGEFLTEMNHQLHPLLQTEEAFIFATACYLTINTETGVLEGAMAGHTVPFIIKPMDEKVTVLDSAEEHSGPALAVTPDHDYQTFSIKLSAGDKILMYTDGICEAMNADQREFGVDYLRESIQESCKLPLKNLLPSIVETVRKYSHGQKMGDDICLLAFTLNGLK